MAQAGANGSNWRLAITQKVFIHTFGCEMNEYDSNKMLDLLAGTEGVVRTNR